MLDFHSHLPSEDSICCTDIPVIPAGKSLMTCEGLLPDKWTPLNQIKLMDDLAENPALHVGEVGLDRRFENILCIENQEKILTEILQFAVAKDRCVSLHCVRATEPMLRILQTLRFRPYSILWHGFTGSIETAKQLSRLGVMISIGPRYRGSVKDLYTVNSHLVPETDYTLADAAEHERILMSQYSRFEEELGLSSQELKKHTCDMLTAFRGF